MYPPYCKTPWDGVWDIIFHLGTFSLGAKRNGTKEFSSLMLENSKCQRFRNGPALEYYIPDTIPRSFTIIYLSKCNKFLMQLQDPLLSILLVGIIDGIIYEKWSYDRWER